MKYFEKLGKKDDNKRKDLKDSALTGLLSGTASSFVTYPIAMMKHPHYAKRPFKTFGLNMLGNWAGIGTGMAVTDYLSNKGGLDKIKEKAQEINPFDKENG